MHRHEHQCGPSATDAVWRYSVLNLGQPHRCVVQSDTKVAVTYLRRVEHGVQGTQINELGRPASVIPSPKLRPSHGVKMVLAVICPTAAAGQIVQTPNARETPCHSMTSKSKCCQCTRHSMVFPSSGATHAAGEPCAAVQLPPGSAAVALSCGPLSLVRRAVFKGVRSVTASAITSSSSPQFASQLPLNE